MTITKSIEKKQSLCYNLCKRRVQRVRGSNPFNITTTFTARRANKDGDTTVTPSNSNLGADPEANQDGNNNNDDEMTVPAEKTLQDIMEEHKKIALLRRMIRAVKVEFVGPVSVVLPRYMPNFGSNRKDREGFEVFDECIADLVDGDDIDLALPDDVSVPFVPTDLPHCKVRIQDTFVYALFGAEQPTNLEFYVSGILYRMNAWFVPFAQLEVPTGVGDHTISVWGLIKIPPRRHPVNDTNALSILASITGVRMEELVATVDPVQRNTGFRGFVFSDDHRKFPLDEALKEEFFNDEQFELHVTRVKVPLALVKKKCHYL